MPAINTTVAFAAGQIQSTSATVLELSDITTITTDDVNRANRARISCSENNMRYRYDGIDPTTSVGLIIFGNTEIELIGNANIRNFRFVRNGGSDSTIFVTLEV